MYLICKAQCLNIGACRSHADVKLLYAIVEEHFALVEKVNTEKMFSDNSALLAQKISDSVIADVLFLKEKMIIPELSLKYPSLFK